MLSRSQIRILMRCFTTRTIQWDFGTAHQKAILLVQSTVPIQRRIAYLTKSVIY
jgi:hypothetical protein